MQLVSRGGVSQALENVHAHREIQPPKAEQVQNIDAELNPSAEVAGVAPAEVGRPDRAYCDRISEPRRERPKRIASVIGLAS